MNCDHWYNVCWDFMCNAMYMLVNGDSSQNISEPFVTPVLIMCVAFALMMHSMMILWPSIHSSSDKTTLEWLPSSKLRQLAIQSSHLDFQLPKQCWMTFTVGRSQDWGFPTPKQCWMTFTAALRIEKCLLLCFLFLAATLLSMVALNVNSIPHIDSLKCMLWWSF